MTIGFNAVASLLGGRVAAATAFWNVEGVALKRAGGRVSREFRVDEYGAPSYPELVLCVTRTTLDDDPALVRAAVARDRARLRVHAHRPREQRAGPARSRAATSTRRAAAQLDAVSPAFVGDAARFGELDLPRLRAWARWEARFGITRRPPDVNAMFGGAAGLGPLRGVSAPSDSTSAAPSRMKRERGTTSVEARRQRAFAHRGVDVRVHAEAGAPRRPTAAGSTSPAARSTTTTSAAGARARPPGAASPRARRPPAARRPSSRTAGPAMTAATPFYCARMRAELLAHRLRATPHLHDLDAAAAHAAHLELAVDARVVEQPACRAPLGRRGVAEAVGHDQPPVPVVLGDGCALHWRGTTAASM